MLSGSGIRQKTDIWDRYSAGIQCRNQMDLLGF